MDEEKQPTEDAEALKARGLQSWRLKTRSGGQVMGEATKTLTAYVEREGSRIKSILEKTDLACAENILIALLEGEISCSGLAELVGIAEQHLSRILPRLEDNQLICSKYLKSALFIIIRKF